MLWFRFEAHAPLLAQMLGRQEATERQTAGASELADLIPPFAQSSKVLLKLSKRRRKKKRKAGGIGGPQIMGNGEDIAGH